MQESLNNYVFQKNQIRDNDGLTLTMRAIVRQTDEGKLSANDLPNLWLSRYSKAMGRGAF